MDFMVEQVAKRISTRAGELGIKQTDIVKKTGVAKSTVNAWFAGRAVPRGGNLTRLCSILRCTSDWLMDGKGAAAKSASSIASALPGSWELSKGDEIDGNLILVPELSVELEKRIDSVKVFESSITSKVEAPASLAWFECLSRASEPFINTGDVVVVDTSDTTLESGAFYAIHYVGGFNVNQVFVEVDGSLTVIDSYRDTKTVVDREQRNKVSFIGRVLARQGFVK